MHQPFSTMLILPASGATDEHLECFLSNAIKAANWFGTKVSLVTNIHAAQAVEAHINKQTNRPVSLIAVKGAVEKSKLRQALDSTGAELLVMPIESLATASKDDLHRHIEIMQDCPAPILLLPQDKKLSRYPFASIVVPMSGEMRYSPALEIALNLAQKRRTPIEIIHVTKRLTHADETTSGCAGCRDQSHHEYPRLIETLVAEGSPFSTPRDWEYIHAFRHFYGSPSNILIREVRLSPRPLVVAEWHGTLAHGRAEILKTLMYTGGLPLLLIRTESRNSARLKVGRQFDARDPDHTRLHHS